MWELWVSVLFRDLTEDYGLLRTASQFSQTTPELGEESVNMKFKAYEYM